MIQVSKDTYEDLTPEIFEELLDCIRARRAAGGRPAERPPALHADHRTDLVDRNSVCRRRHASGPAEAEARSACGAVWNSPGPGGPAEGRGCRQCRRRTLEAEQQRRKGRAPKKGGGTDPASTLAAQPGEQHASIRRAARTRRRRVRPERAPVLPRSRLPIRIRVGREIPARSRTVIPTIPARGADDARRQGPHLHQPLRPARSGAEGRALARRLGRHQGDPRKGSRRDRRRDEEIRPARPRRGGLSDRPQMVVHAEAVGRAAALSRRQRRRVGARHLQGPRDHAARSASSRRGLPDRLLRHGRERRLHLRARRIHPRARGAAARRSTRPTRRS